MDALIEKFQKQNTGNLVMTSILLIVPTGITMYVTTKLIQLSREYYMKRSDVAAAEQRLQLNSVYQANNDNEVYGQATRVGEQVAFNNLSAETINKRITDSLNVYKEYNANVKKFSENARMTDTIDVVDKNVLDASNDNW